MDHLQLGDFGFMDRKLAHGKSLALSHGNRELEPVCGKTGSLKSANASSPRNASVPTETRKSRRGFHPFRKRPIAFYHRGARDKEGFLILQLAVLWLPLLAIFGIILCLRMKSLSHLEKQRTLDRCVFPLLQTRCAVLNQLSQSNALLRKIAIALAALKTGSKLAILIPGIGPAISVVAGSSADALRESAKAIGHYQDFFITAQKTAKLAAWQCGFSTKFETMQFTRPTNVTANIAQVPAPLAWQTGIASSEIDVRGWTGNTRSFGHCKGSAELNGETYQIVFEHAPRGKQPLNRFFF